jgi:hypothetical protein
MPWNEVMGKWKSGQLRSGGTGPRVTNRKQAIAIMLSEKRKAEEGKTEYQPDAAREAMKMKRKPRRT